MIKACIGFTHNMVDVMRQEQRLVKHLRLPQFETSSIRFATFQLNLIVFNRECIAWPSVDYKHSYIGCHKSLEEYKRQTNSVNYCSYTAAHHHCMLLSWMPSAAVNIHRCSFVVKCKNTGKKNAHPLVWLPCKVLHPGERYYVIVYTTILQTT